MGKVNSIMSIEKHLDHFFQHQSITQVLATLDEALGYVERNRAFVAYNALECHKWERKYATLQEIRGLMVRLNNERTKA